VTDGGTCARKRRQLRPDRIDHGHGVGVRLLLDRKHDGAPPLNQVAILSFSTLS
jgi:hypothetical protein